MKIYLINEKGKFDITHFVPTITLSGDYLQAARSITLGVIASPDDPHIPVIDAELGNVVQIFEFNEEIFYGYITDRGKNTNGKTIEIVCFDKGLYLKTKYSYKFSNITPEDITRKIATDYKINVGNLAVTGIKISRNFLGSSLYSTIIGSYYQASIKNGKKYMIRFINNNLNVVEKGEIASAQILGTGSNLLTANVSESIRDMVNSVAVFDKDDNLQTVIKNENDIKLFGLMQEYVKVSENEDFNAKANAMFKGVERKITVTNFGNIRCITGNGIIVQEPYTKLFGLFYIDSDTHTWKNGIYTNNLTLNFRNMMDENEVGEAMSSNKTSNITVQWTPESQKALQ
jgi:hypothetical protein